MKQYLDLVKDILDNGSWQENRTGVRTKSISGAMMKFDMTEGFPAVTTRRLPFKSAIGELVGFVRGYRSAADFRALGCKVWDQNANENAQWLANPYRIGKADDLGAIYGVQWRSWPAYKLIDGMQPNARKQIEDALMRGFRRIGETDEGETILYKPIDQLRECLDTIMRDPGSRRILFHGWNCAQLDEMALPPCHLLYQFNVNQARHEISLCLYVRSNDIGLGAPFNLCEAGALLHLVARLTGYTPRWLTYFIGDAHIYETHLGMLEAQLDRTPLPAPSLRISDRIPSYADTQRYTPEWIERVAPEDFELVGYKHHPPLSAPMAV